MLTGLLIGLFVGAAIGIVILGAFSARAYDNGYDEGELIGYDKGREQGYDLGRWIKD